MAVINLSPSSHKRSKSVPADSQLAHSRQEKQASCGQAHPPASWPAQSWIPTRLLEHLLRGRSGRVKSASMGGFPRSRLEPASWRPEIHCLGSYAGQLHGLPETILKMQVILMHVIKWFHHPDPWVQLQEIRLQYVLVLLNRQPTVEGPQHLTRSEMMYLVQWESSGRNL